MTSTGAPRWRQLADGIRDEIQSGARAPGSKLPSVAALDTAGYSQTTTMRAYRELVTEGWAVTVHGSGTYVADPLPNHQPQVTVQELEARIRALEERVGRLDGSHI